MPPFPVTRRWISGAAHPTLWEEGRPFAGSVAVSAEKTVVPPPPLRWLLLALGWSCVGLGAVGAFLPVLPTTPFLLVAAWAFARSSARLRAWLYGHRRFGPALRAWHEHGAIPRRGKVASVVGMSASFAYILCRADEPWLPVLVGVVLVCVGAFVLTRPEPPPEPDPAE